MTNKLDGRFRETAERYGLDALEVLHSALGSKNDHTRIAAARDLATLVSRLPNIGKEPEPSAAQLTPAERDERLTAALSSPDVRAFLEKNGWRPPIETSASEKEEP